MGITIEFEPPSESGPCECCGGKTTSLTRFVYKDGNARAIYYARFSDNHPEGRVKAAVSIGRWGEGSSPAQRTAFALELRAGPDNTEVMVCDAATSPWDGAEILGPMLDRDAALGHPLIDEIFHLADRALVEDEPLRAYLESTHRLRSPGCDRD